MFDEATQFRSKCTFSPILLNESYSCADLFNNQPTGSISFSHGQYETDAHLKGNIHFIISYRRTLDYGIQIQIYTNQTVLRYRLNNSFTSWYVLAKT